MFYGEERKKLNMATIFIYYVLGFAAFLAVAYLCAQMGWLFEAEGRIHWSGLAGLSVFLVAIFVFITLVCSVQLSGWQPPQVKISEGINAAKRLQAQFKDVNVADSVKNFKDGGEQIAGTIGSVWEEHGNFGLTLASTQGVTAMNMLVHDISEEGFLNRMNPLNLVNFEKKDAGKTDAAAPAADAQMPEEEKQRLADQEALRIRVAAIEKRFNKKIKVPDTVLPEQLRRIEEVYLAISTGEVKYPYLRFEFAFPRSQALSYLEKYEKNAAKTVSVKIPVLIELFGDNFDLGLCTLHFSDVRVEPALEKAKLDTGKSIKIRIIPNQKPGQIVAAYDKFQSAKPSGEAQDSGSGAPKV